jgi:hypothetical protein
MRESLQNELPAMLDSWSLLLFVCSFVLIVVVLVVQQTKKEEQERGITIKSSGVSLYFEMKIADLGTHVVFFLFFLF